MSNVLVDKNKIDILANAISAKSGEAVTMTLDEMVSAVDGIETGGGTPTLETITKTYTPSEQAAVTDSITPSSGYDGIGEVDVTVSAIPFGVGEVHISADYYNDNGRKWKTTAYYQMTQDGWMNGTSDGVINRYNAIATGTSVTPTESAQTIGGANTMMEGAVTVNAIPSNYVGSGITQRTSSDLTASNLTVTAPSGYYASNASKTLSDANLTAENIKKDVNIFGVTGSYEGGGGMSIATASTTLNSANASISFTGLQDEPTSFVITTASDLATGASPWKTACVVYDGTSVTGSVITNTNNAQVTYDNTGFSQSYNGGTLTVTGTSTNFQANEYKLVYTYGGSSANISTSDVQVGSGATSISFTGLTDEPSYFSLIFKSNFGTSSGYQRVITVVYDGNTTYGLAMDSGAKAQTSWSYTYNAGTLTISSTGTNNGGYFHQPGYYQLTYAVDSSAPQYESVSKTYRASTTAQSETITPSSGYDAIEEVSVSIPAVTQTNLTAANIKSGTTVSISNGSTNLWSVTGTYTGGGTSKNVQVLQSTSRTNASSLTKVLGDLTVSKTGTYDIYWSGGRTNTSTSYTWGTMLYVDGTGYGTENTTWSNNCQSNHLSNVSLTANQKLSVYARGRTGSYYTFAPMLVIVEA